VSLEFASPAMQIARMHLQRAWTGWTGCCGAAWGSKAALPAIGVFANDDEPAVISDRIRETLAD
jgi:hypothetical protein